MSSTQETSVLGRTKDRSMKTATEQEQSLESLREKCQEFSRLVSSHQDVHVQVTDVSNND